jgi:hypothetical protein
LIPNPILKVLSTMSCHTVRHLLIGGQACVLYGAAEFSRDCDLVILADDENLGNLQSALAALQADCIAVPEFRAEYLQRGHAIHFRCQHPDVTGLRIDIMSQLRGCDSFEDLYDRRTTIEDPETDAVYEVVAVADLVRAKKTQLDKDWPMIRRLVEAHYDFNRYTPTTAMVLFWLRESRTPSMLAELLQRFPESVDAVVSDRPWLRTLDSQDPAQTERLLRAEEDAQRQADREYWQPLKEELEQLRLNRPRRKN